MDTSKPLLDNLAPAFTEGLVSRRDSLFTMGKLGVALAALGSLPVTLGTLSQKAFAQSPAGIIDILNFALTLEYLESEFYVTGSASLGAALGQDKAAIDQIAKHEVAHVAVLKATIGQLGGTPVAKPEFDFTAGGAFANVFSNPTTFLAVAQAFEDTGVRAYKGQAGGLMSNKGVLTAALQIHSVEARHASEIRRIRGIRGWISGKEPGTGMPPATQPVYDGEEVTTQLGVMISGGANGKAGSESFDEPLTMAQVLVIAGLFIKK